MIENVLGIGDSVRAGESPLTELLKAMQFNRTIAMNTLSPLKNLTQQLNTLAEVGPVAWIQGYKDLFNPERMAIVRASGARIDFGPIMQELQKIKGEGALSTAANMAVELAKWGGIAFRLTEETNQVVAFLQALRRAEQFLPIGPEAIRYARSVQGSTQFGRRGSDIPLLANASGFVQLLGQYKKFYINQLLFPFRGHRQRDPTGRKSRRASDHRNTSF